MSEQRSMLLKRIREYRDRFEELSSAHHFCFDLPINRMSEKVDAMVLGINPADPKQVLVAGPTEETFEYDYQEVAGREFGSRRWFDHAVTFCGTSNVILSEFFFWSCLTGQFEESYA